MQPLETYVLYGVLAHLLNVFLTICQGEQGSPGPAGQKGPPGPLVR